MNQQLPGASSAMTMGILSIVLSLCCCGPFGAIFSIIGLSNAKSAENIYRQQPGEFSGYENVKTGRVLSYIGIAIAAIQLVIFILYFSLIIAFISSGGLEHIE
ncbi:MAG: CCC motif membrane protein [Flavobacteriaceae bacterium]